MHRTYSGIGVSSGVAYGLVHKISKQVNDGAAPGTIEDIRVALESVAKDLETTESSVAITQEIFAAQALIARDDVLFEAITENLKFRSSEYTKRLLAER